MKSKKQRGPFSNEPTLGQTIAAFIALFVMLYVLAGTIMQDLPHPFPEIVEKMHYFLTHGVAQTIGILSVFSVFFFLFAGAIMLLLSLAHR